MDSPRCTSEIHGRVQSIIQGADGRYLPGTFFAHYLKEFDYALKRFQVVQEEEDRISYFGMGKPTLYRRIVTLLVKARN